jgi:hypothetical protein
MDSTERIKELEELLTIYKAIADELPRASDYKHYVVDCSLCSKPTLNSSAISCACDGEVCYKCIKSGRFPGFWKELEKHTFFCLHCHQTAE